MIARIWHFFLENRSAKQTIVKNAFWLGASTAFTKLLFLALVIYAARILGAEGYGQFTFALAFVSLFVIFSNLGISSIIVREFAHDKEQQEQFYSLLSLRFILVFGTFLLIGVGSFFISPNQDVQKIIIALALFVLLNSVVNICYAFFHARQKMEYEAWFEAVQALMIFGAGLFVLHQFPSPLHLGYAYILPALVTLVLVFGFFHWRVLRLSLRWDRNVWKKFLRMSWPLALMGAFGAVYSYTDSVMLGYWGLLTETGWYNAAYKIVMASLVPMGLIGAAFYPALSRFLAESKERLQRAWAYEIEIMVALAIPLVVGGVVLAHTIIESFYPADFGPSVPAFQILIGTAGLIFLYRPMYDAMIVLNQQQKTFWITVAGAAVNVALNLILIPTYSLYGAAIATTGTHFLTLVMIVLFLKKFTTLSFPLVRILLTVVGAVGATAAMYGVITAFWASQIHVLLLVSVGALVYVVTFLLIRTYILSRYFQYAYT